MRSIITKTSLILNLLIWQLAYYPVIAASPVHHAPLLKEMFHKVTIEKNAAMIPVYYHKEFRLFSNGKEMSYDDFLKTHINIYKTAIQYKIRYDESTWTEQDNNIAARVFITTKTPHEPPHEIEVILIAKYRDNKLYRLWELTYPDWSKMKSLQTTKNGHK